MLALISLFVILAAMVFLVWRNRAPRIPDDDWIACPNCVGGEFLSDDGWAPCSLCDGQGGWHYHERRWYERMLG